jgi:hypothetical protein
LNEIKIAEFRRQAEVCASKAEVAADEASKLFYVKLAEGWIEMAEKLEREPVLTERRLKPSK